MNQEKIKATYELLKEIRTFIKKIIDFFIGWAIIVMGALTAIYCISPTIFKLILKTATSLDLDFLNSLELLELKGAELKKAESLLLEADKNYNKLLSEKSELEIAYTKSQAEREVFYRQINPTLKGGWLWFGICVLVGTAVGVGCAGVFTLHLCGLDMSGPVNRLLLSAISSTGSLVAKALLPHILEIMANTQQTHDALEEHIHAMTQQNNFTNAGIRVMIDLVRAGNARN